MQSIDSTFDRGNHLIIKFFQNEVVSRINSIVGMPLSTIFCLFETIIGSGVGIVSIITLGKHLPTLNFAARHLSNGEHLISLPYAHLLTFINPRAEFTKYDDEDFDPSSKIKIHDIANKNARANNFLKRYVLSRLSYALLATSCVISRVAKGIVGIPVAVFSMITFGKFESMNDLSYRSLRIPGIIGELFFCTIKIINPQSETTLELW